MFLVAPLSHTTEVCGQCNSHMAWVPAALKTRLACYQSPSSHIWWEVTFGLEFEGLLYSSFYGILCEESAVKHLPFPSPQTLNSWMCPVVTKDDLEKENFQLFIPTVYTFLTIWSGHTPIRCCNRSSLTWIFRVSGDSLSLTSVCLSIRKLFSHLGQIPQDWTRSVFIPIPKKGNAKECSNYHTIELISHTSKLMLKILQARLQQYMNHDLPDIQAGCRKGRGIRSQIANICWSIKKAREFQKKVYFCFTDYAKAFDCVDHNKQ